MKAIAAAVLLALLGITFPTHADQPPGDVVQCPSCLRCGMDRLAFGHSRMVITYEDRTVTGACSLRCAAVELADALDKTPAMIQVADYQTKKLVDVEKAAWVIGGSKNGVMTRRAKWAFEKRSDAEAFIKENGGKIVSFDEAVREAYADLYEDGKMIRERRKMKRMQQKGGAL